MVDKLRVIQNRLKAPKDRYNSFGKYKYRSAESILEAVKPLLNEQGLTMTLSDEIEQYGDRLFLKATAAITGGEDIGISVSALAEIPIEKKGMDASQITGTASSYARKYALNGLFLIDDTKDADTDEYHRITTREEPKEATAIPGPEPVDEYITEAMYKVLRDKCKAKGKSLRGVFTKYGCEAAVDMTVDQWKNAVAQLDALPDK